MIRALNLRANREVLAQRAAILRKIRVFFELRDVMEVETPLVGLAASTDPNLHSFTVSKRQTSQVCYLQTSPEFFMKRLLASGSGSIYQITKAFRAEEVGRFHQPEFTLLEWYRVDFDHFQLMHEVAELLSSVFNQSLPWEKKTYCQVFQDRLGINPHHCNVRDLQACARAHNLDIGDLQLTQHDMWLDLLFSHCIQPFLGMDKPIFIYDYPASQAMLSRLYTVDKTRVAARFELFMQGVELANGFHELTDADEQRQRFDQELRCRKQLNLPKVPIDEALLQSFESGMPDCAGVALGIDRLVMLFLQASDISSVMGFAC